MAGVSSTIRLNDAMTNPLRNINKALSLVINNFEKMQRVSGNSVNTADLVKAKTYLSQADRQLDELVSDTNKASQAQKNYNSQVKKGVSEAEGLGSKIKGMATALGGLYVVKQGIGLLNECSQKASNLAQAETKLGEVMHAMQGASSSQIQGIKNLSGEISANGVVGKTALINGAQQVSTYFHQTKAVETLLPKMADLAVQMHGVNVTSEDMVNVGNMFGKVMTGQVGALRRAGISFDEYQEKVMKNGTEMEKANMLAQVIEQNVGHMNDAMANTPEGAIAMVKKDFEGVKTAIGQDLRGNMVGFYSSIHDMLPAVKFLASGFSKVVSLILRGLTQIIKFAGKVVSFFQENWSLISPIIYGIIGALTIYYGRLLWIKVAELATAAASGAMAIAKGLAAAATVMFTSATWAETTAQWGLNSAMYACPLVWILMLIIAVIAVIYMVIAAINKVTGSTISATGVICGAIATVGAIIINIIIGVINAIIQLVWSIFVEPFIGIIEWVLNVVNGGFDSFGGAVANLIGQIISWFLSLGKVVTKIIDAIFGTNWTDGLSSLQDKVTSWGKNENSISLSREAPQIDGRIQYGDAYNAGYDFGSSIDDKVSSMFDSKNNLSNKDAYSTDVNDKIASNTADTASNTQDIADKLDVTSDQLKYIREYAEREAINRFTTANINVKMTNNNNINSEADVDGILDAMTTGIKNQMNIVAEGGA